MKNKNIFIIKETNKLHVLLPRTLALAFPLVPSPSPSPPRPPFRALALLSRPRPPIMPTHPLASSLAPTPSLSCPPSISPQLSPLRALTLLLAPSPVWRSGGACSGVGRVMGCWKTWGCQCGRACSVTAKLTGVQGWGAQRGGRGGRCWARRGRVTAGGAREAALVGRRIVARPVRWRPSRGGSVAQWGCRTWRTRRRRAP